MASDSEPRKFFSEAPSRPPQKSHFWEQKACDDSAGVEVDKQQQRRLQRFTERIIASSFPTDVQYTLPDCHKFSTLGR